MKGSAMNVLGQVVEGNIITDVHDLCSGGGRSREILISVTYQNANFDVLVLNLATRQLTRLTVKDSRNAKRIGMLLNNISTPPRFRFQTGPLLEVHVSVNFSRYVLVREEHDPVYGDHWVAVGDGQLK